MSSSDIEIEKGAADDFIEQATTSANPKLQGNHIEGNTQLLDGAGHVRLIPTPSNSPNDPLRFSALRKWGALITVAWFSTMALSIVGGFGALAPYFFGLYIPQGVSPDHIARLLTWPSLFTGIGNFAFIPLALVFGRRPVFLFAALLLVAASAWAAKSGTSFNSHLSARLVQGFAAGATESLLPLIITDMTFIHERSTYFGIYWVIQSIVTAILNTASSYEAIKLDWTWYYWIFVILNSIGVLMVFFLVPETKFDRPAFAIDGQMTKVDAFGTLVVLSDEEARQVAPATQESTNELSTSEHATSYVSTLKPWSSVDVESLKLIGTTYLHMIKALGDPAILWALGASSAVLGINICESLSFGSILETAYGWPSQNTGLIYLGALPAGVFAFYTSGWGGDKINLWLAKRNGGVHLPEHRLPAVLFPVVTGLAATVMYGFCADKAPDVHWFSIVFSNNYCTYQFICVLIMTTTYAVESMTHHAGAALVMVVGGKNIVSFGMAQGIVPLANSGRNAYAKGILAGATAGWMLLEIPLYLLMPKYRARGSSAGK